MKIRRTPSRLTAPSVEPVTLADLKLFARIDDDGEDALLTAFIEAARIAAEDFTRRAFITQSWKLTVDLPCYGWANSLPDGVYDLPVSALYGALPDAIRLLRPPVPSVTSVTTYDTADTSGVFSPSNYTLDAAGPRLVLKQGATWPTGLRQFVACEIVTSNGYGASGSNVPQPIRQAILMHAAAMYEERGQCGSEVPPGCKLLLQPYRVMDML